MIDAANLMTFTGNPLDRASDSRVDPEWVNAQLASPSALFLPLYRGDPLIRDGRAILLAAPARHEFPRGASFVFLGLRGDAPYFAVDFSAAPSPQDAPFADLGDYAAIREAAFILPGEDMAIIGEARWFFDWHRRHLHCAVCGAPTEIKDGGAKRRCPQCAAEHFPRSDPVAIVLAAHDDACLLGRGPHFPPGFLSALAGFVEACETPEECAVRELREEAGVRISNVRYQFSQPWPFPSSLMMGFIADADDRALTLDTKEIAEARWMERAEIKSLLAGERREDVKLPPRFTIARRLLERWAAD
ncbi:MAG TPA: NAD(+) diphosphatase [Parvularculaceae bacterium]|nr:NAD(+) diphosphatase [Parvularculaceae bacterium]